MFKLLLKHITDNLRGYNNPFTKKLQNENVATLT